MENLCNICPRKCNINRNKNMGFCKSNNNIKIAKVMLHYFEEPIISGENTSFAKANGSGAIFFSNCNLKCCYCQNSNISSNGSGKEISVSALADLFKQLETAGANNINLVTPTHYTQQIIEALNIYKPAIPIIWNTSGYEDLETIKLLKNYVDIYLTDIKYYSYELSQKYSQAKDYFKKASVAVLQMRKNQPLDIIEKGLMKKGLIIRHLVLPNQTKDSFSVVEWINQNLGNQTYLSLMSQYVPMANAVNHPEINRKIKPIEYKILLNLLNKLNFSNVFTQELESANSCYTPDFEIQDNDFKY